MTLPNWVMILDPSIYKTGYTQALSSLLDEVHTGDDAKIMHTAICGSCKTNARAPYQNFPLTGRSCPLGSYRDCSDTSHFLSEYCFLPDQDRRYIAKARQIANILDHSSEAPSTRIGIKLFSKTEIFFSVCPSCPHINSVFSHKYGGFWKCSLDCRFLKIFVWIIENESFRIQWHQS